jgi:hypothetical protein
MLLNFLSSPAHPYVDPLLVIAGFIALASAHSFEAKELPTWSANAPDYWKPASATAYKGILEVSIILYKYLRWW